MLHICRLQKFGTCQQISFLGKTSSLSGPKKLSPEKSFIPGKDDLKDLIGSYYSIECGGEYTLALQNDSLWMVDHAQKKMFMQPVSKNVFKTDGNLEIRFKSFGTNKQMYVSLPRARNVKFERK